MKYIENDIGLKVDLVKHPDTSKYIPFEWRDVVGYEGSYQVSNYGHVKSLDRYVKYKNRGSRVHKGRLLKPQLSNCGYLQIGLRKNKVSKRYLVHRLVAEAFIDNKRSKICVNHRNSVKTDNIEVNLEWSSHKENTRHAIDSGTFITGKNAKLTEEEVIDIVNLIDSSNLTFKDIAEKFNVSKSVIGKINTGDSWNSLTGRKGKVTPSDLKGVNNPRSKKVVNCRGEVFELMKEAASEYSISHSGITKACKKGLTAGTYSDGTRIKWKYYNKDNQ